VEFSRDIRDLAEKRAELDRLATNKRSE